MKKLIIILFTLIVFWINFVYSAVNVTNCSAPSNTDWTHNKYVWWVWIPWTCANHNFYNSLTFTVVGNRADTNGENFKTSCWVNGFPFSFTETATTVTVHCITRDDIAPTLLDVTVTQLSWINLLANNAQITNLTVWVNGGAPITNIQAEFEDSSTCWWNFINKSSSSSPLNHFFDISEVNIWCDFNAAWFRRYDFNITNITDEAWNTLAAPINYFYNVYANTNNIWTSSINLVERNNLELNTNYSDGVLKPLNVELKDIYWNEIIPAAPISRTIGFNINRDNTMYLDQYTRTSSSSIILKDTLGTVVSGIWNWTDILANQISATWFYPLGVRVYTPTANSVTWGKISDINAHYTINNITTDITDTLWWTNLWIPITNTNNIQFRFNPLFQTTISWDIFDYWFLEWVKQNSSLQIQANTWTTPPRSVFIKFSSGSTNQDNPDLTLSLSGSMLPDFVSLRAWITSFNNLLDPYFNNLWLVNYDTRLNISSWATINSITNSTFSTHIAYNLWGYSITQNSDIIWKPSYHSLISSWTTSAVWIKILGISSTTKEKTHELIINQNMDDIHILWKLDKTITKRDLKKNILTFIKNILPDQNDVDISWTIDIKDLTWKKWLNIDWKRIYNNKILYFWDTWGIVHLWNNDELIEWRKTIIIEWMDLYIEDDMYYWDIEKDILWIIVLSDINWNGWNIYIDPSVTNIVWTMYADKALISYNWLELWWWMDQNLLKNQLHIYGSIFSENTLWWSINNICPYYITSGDCITWNNQEKRMEAQKYDLNYLRRYFIIWGEPVNWWKVIWWWTCPLWVCSWENWNFVRVITNLVTDPLAKYPVVIEYNPLQQTTPPPLFDK